MPDYQTKHARAIAPIAIDCESRCMAGSASDPSHPCYCDLQEAWSSIPRSVEVCRLLKWGLTGCFGDCLWRERSAVMTHDHHRHDRMNVEKGMLHLARFGGRCVLRKRINHVWRAIELLCRLEGTKALSPDRESDRS